MNTGLLKFFKVLCVIGIVAGTICVVVSLFCIDTNFFAYVFSSGAVSIITNSICIRFYDLIETMADKIASTDYYFNDYKTKQTLKENAGQKELAQLNARIKQLEGEKN